MSENNPQPTVKRLMADESSDFFPTPPWAVHALLECERFRGNIWEPACGDGVMAEVLSSLHPVVFASDKYDHGYGLTGHDFLTSDRLADNVVTNPPFNRAQQFAEKALTCSRDKVALLLRLAFLEGARRADTLFKNYPPARVWVFSERITFYPKDVERAGSGTMAYAWFVWDKTYEGPTTLCWIPTGLRKKYSEREETT